MTDDFRAHQTNCSKNVVTLVTTNKSLESDVAALKHSNFSLQESVVDLKYRSMRDNLIFVGVDETSNNETCEHLLRHFLTKYIEQDQTININNNIKIADIQFARVHRLNGGPD